MDTTKPMPLKKELCAAFRSNTLQYQGSYATPFVLDEYPLPCIGVRARASQDTYDAAIFRLPIDSSVAQDAQQWYNKSKIELGNDYWKSWINNKVLPKTRECLGIGTHLSTYAVLQGLSVDCIGRQSAIVENLKPSKDGAIAHILISLPSTYSGGSLKFSIGNSCTEIDVAQQNATSVACIVFHNLMTITSENIHCGSRVALIYSLQCQSTALSPFATLDSDLMALDNAMSCWRECTDVKVLLRPFKHIYSMVELCSSQLHGRDSNTLTHIKPLAEKYGFDLYIAIMLEKILLKPNGSEIKLSQFSAISRTGIPVVFEYLPVDFTQKSTEHVERLVIGEPETHSVILLLVHPSYHLASPRLSPCCRDYVQASLSSGARQQLGGKKSAQIFINNLLDFCETQVSLPSQDLDLATSVIMHGHAKLGDFDACKKSLELEFIKQRLASIDLTDLQGICMSFMGHAGFCGIVSALLQASQPVNLGRIKLLTAWLKPYTENQQKNTHYYCPTSSGIRTVHKTLLGQETMDVLKSLGPLSQTDFAALDELADAIPVGILTGSVLPEFSGRDRCQDLVLQHLAEHMVTSMEFDTSTGNYTGTMKRLIDLVEFCVKADYVEQLQLLLQRFTEDFRMAPVEKRSEKLGFLCEVLRKWHHHALDCQWSSDQSGHFVGVYCLAAQELLDRDFPTSDGNITTLVKIVSRSGLLRRLVSRLSSAMDNLLNEDPDTLLHYATALRDVTLKLEPNNNTIDELIQRLLLKFLKTIDIESLRGTPSRYASLDPTEDLHSAIEFCGTFSRATSTVLVEYLVTRLTLPTGTEAQGRLVSHLQPFLSIMLDHFHGTNLSAALCAFVANTLYQYARICVGNGPPGMVDRIIQGVRCGYGCRPCYNLVEGLLDSNHTLKISEPCGIRRHLESRLKNANGCGVTWQTDTSDKMHKLIVKKDTEMIEYGVIREARSTARGMIEKLGMPRAVRRVLGDHYHEIFKWLRLDIPNLTPTPEPSPSLSPAPEVESVTPPQRKSTPDDAVAASTSDNSPQSSNSHGLLSTPCHTIRKHKRALSVPRSTAESSETSPPAKRQRRLPDTPSGDSDSGVSHSSGSSDLLSVLKLHKENQETSDPTQMRRPPAPSVSGSLCVEVLETLPARTRARRAEPSENSGRKRGESIDVQGSSDSEDDLWV